MDAVLVLLGGKARHHFDYGFFKVDAASHASLNLTSLLVYARIVTRILNRHFPDDVIFSHTRKRDANIKG